MKVLFLDIDGVLNGVEDWIEEDRIGHQFNKGPDQINRTKLGLLQLIVDRTDCKIVISSTWRTLFNLDQLYEKFRERGLKAHRTVFVGVTTDLGFWKPRGAEIKAWLDIEVESYAILDDDDDMLEEQAPYFVRTDFNRGISYEDARKVISVLNRNDILSPVLTPPARHEKDVPQNTCV